jgi:RNase P protein component
LLPKKHRLIGKEVIFLTKKRQYIRQGMFGFFYAQQYPNLAYNQISSHVTIKLSKRAVVRHTFKRAIVQYIQEHMIIRTTINDRFYKIFVVFSKDALPELEKKIANFTKKDTIRYVQAEFEKAWK